MDTNKLNEVVASLAAPPATASEMGQSQVSGDLYLQKTIVASLTQNFGVYDGDWTEASIRQANVMDMDPAKKLEESLNAAHPTGKALPRSDIYGHWMLPNGTLTGQLHDHEQSAQTVLTSMPGYKQQVDPIFDLMRLSGVIRVRYAKDKHLVVDIVRRPSSAQLQQLATLADSVEKKGGTFMFSVLTPNDTETLAEGMSVDDLLNVDWRRIPR